MRTKPRRYFSRFSNASLRTKFILLLVGVSTLSLLTVGSITLYNLNTTLTNDIRNKLLTDLENKISDFNGTLTTYGADVKYLSRLPSLKQYAEALETGKDPESLEQVRQAITTDFDAFARSRLIYNQIQFIDPSGREILRLKGTPSGTFISAALSELGSEADDYYFKESIGLPRGGLYVSQLDLSEEAGIVEIPYKPVIRFATPVYFSGKLYGIVLTTVLADNFLEHLGLTKIPSFLVDTDGYFVYHPDNSKQWGRETGVEASLSSEVPQLASVLGSETGGTIVTEDRFYSYSPITLQGENTPRWYLISYTPASEASRPVVQALYLGIGLIVVAIALMTILAYFISRTVTNPLINLTQAAEKVAAGNLNIQAPVMSGDEIGTLATVFNTMAARLQDLFSNLENRVEERTQELQQRTLQLQATAEVGSAISSMRDLGELLNRVTRLISERFGYYHVGIFLLDEEGQYAVLRAANSEGGQRMLARGHRLKVGEVGIVGFVTSKQEPRIALDVGKDATYFDNPDLPETRSELALPLVSGGKTLGALDVQSKASAAFIEEDVAVLQILADQLAVAIENATLFTENEAALVETQTALQAARRAYGEVSTAAWEKLIQSGTLCYAASERGVLKAKNKNWWPDMIAATQTGKTVQKEADSIVVPIKIRGEAVGAIRFRKPAGTRSWTQDDMELMENLTEQLSIALESARLYTETQKRAERERMVTEITTKIRSTNDPQVMLQTAMNELRQALQASQAQISITSELVAPGMVEDGENGKSPE